MWLIGIPLVNDQDAFWHYQASASALDVVLFHNIGRICALCTVSSESRHGDAVLQSDAPDLERTEECVSARPLVPRCLRDRMFVHSYVLLGHASFFVDGIRVRSSATGGWVFRIKSLLCLRQLVPSKSAIASKYSTHQWYCTSKQKSSGFLL